MRVHACKSYSQCFNTGSNSTKGWVEPSQPPGKSHPGYFTGSVSQMNTLGLLLWKPRTVGKHDHIQYKPRNVKKRKFFLGMTLHGHHLQPIDIFHK